MNTQVTIDTRKIGAAYKPFVIAEMSGNHNQSLERALTIVEAAELAGADAVKLQTYTPDTMTINCKENGFFIDDLLSLWKGKSLYQLYEEAILLGNGINQFLIGVKSKDSLVLAPHSMRRLWTFWNRWTYLVIRSHPLRTRISS